MISRNSNSPVAQDPQTDSLGSRANLVEGDQRSVESSVPTITLFAVPKPFGEKVDVIQRNAIRSWAALSPKIDVLLIGDEEGIEATADELGVRHAGGLRLNTSGTPLLSSAFEIAHRESTSSVLVYCNSDVILLNDFVQALHRLAGLHQAHPELQNFVGYGRRTDLQVDEEVDFENKNSIQALMERLQREGEDSPIVCKEYFAFNRALFQSIPDFAVGRGNWDNWMIHNAKFEQRIPVVDLSPVARIIHQSHDYSHTQKSRWSCYVDGEEARENQQLAGGKHIISGATPTWRLDQHGARKLPFSWLNLSFWLDVPRFLRLMMDLMTRR